MLDADVAAAFEDIEEADEIGVGILMRVAEGVAYAGLCAEVDDALRTFLVEDIGDGDAVGEIGLDEAEVGGGSQLIEAA